jgi:WD40 repeat protein
MKVFGKDFMDWANPNAKADESIWEDAEDGDFEKDPSLGKKDLKEAFNETSSGGIQSLVMGALDHSFLVSDNGIEAVKNMASGVRGKGNTVKYESTMVGVGSTSTPRKAMLMRGEMNMMLLSPAVDNLHSSGVHQLDLPTGKVVAEWKFEKDGTPITMLDMTNESKGSQLDTSESTFLGLDDNRLCRWDMRDRHGIVQDISTPVLNWADGHQFSRGTNFQCFATTGDGFVAVGSKDGKVRLYGNSSMRMAKTAFPGLGSPITHIDVTFDGKWVLATTDSYLILISTMFKDKDGRIKTGFSGRGGNKFAPPRLLKLTPLDAHLAGPDNKLRNGQFSWVSALLLVFRIFPLFLYLSLSHSSAKLHISDLFV